MDRIAHMAEIYNNLAPCGIDFFDVEDKQVGELAFATMTLREQAYAELEDKADHPLWPKTAVRMVAWERPNLPEHDPTQRRHSLLTGHFLR